MIETTKQKCHFCGEQKENCFSGFTAMILPNESMEAKIDRWGRMDWWINFERTDLTEEESEELNHLSLYDQALNTVGKGVMCPDCMKEEDRLYKKYYPHMI